MSIGYILKDFKNDILVETGSATGKAISLALKFGFKDIYSVDINPDAYEFCKKKFVKHSNVHLFLGDSADVLPEILKNIDKKATFLLDAHLNSMNCKYKGKMICPIMKEIDCIFSHNKKYNIHHDIIIDDRKYFSGKVDFFDNIKESDIIEVIKNLDDHYEIKHAGRSYNGIIVTFKESQ